MLICYVDLLHWAFSSKMMAEYFIAAFTVVSVVGTLVTLALTIREFWKIRRIGARESKSALHGSRQLSLDPSRPLPTPDSEAEKADTDLLELVLDSDRPPPPPDSEAEKPDLPEEALP
jgi:hypothetical protein